MPLIVCPLHLQVAMDSGVGLVCTEKITQQFIRGPTVRPSTVTSRAFMHWDSSCVVDRDTERHQVHVFGDTPGHRLQELTV